MFIPTVRRSFAATQSPFLIRGVRNEIFAAERTITTLHLSSSATILRKSNQRVPTKVNIQRSAFSTAPQIKQQDQSAETAAEEIKEMDDGEKNIHDILTREFQPEHLEVRDVSGGCGSFYAIVVASEQFNGKSTVKAHRLVNEALKDVIAGIHGLQLRTMPIKK